MEAPRNSARKFIALVHQAYPEVVEKPMLRDSQIELFWQILTAINRYPEIVNEKSVRHNLGPAKLAWIDRLAEKSKAQAEE